MKTDDRIRSRSDEEGNVAANGTRNGKILDELGTGTTLVLDNADDDDDENGKTAQRRELLLQMKKTSLANSSSTVATASSTCPPDSPTSIATDGDSWLVDACGVGGSSGGGKGRKRKNKKKNKKKKKSASNKSTYNDSDEQSPRGGGNRSPGGRESILKTKVKYISLDDVPPLPALDMKKANASSAKSKKSTKKVQFGQVSVREYKRGVGVNAVPTDGCGYPLGLTDEIVCQVDDWTVDTYATAASTTSNSKKNSKGGAPNSVEVSLARPQCEQWRKETLLSAMDSHYHFKHNETNDHKHKKNHDGSPASRTRKKKNSQKHPNNQANQYHNAELEHTFQDVRNELERLRNDRSETGCSCSKLHVHVGGRKGMHEFRLQEELKKRGFDPREILKDANLDNTQMKDANVRKEVLAKALQAAVDKEPCCQDGSCPCAKDGIACNEMACNCWLASHTGKNKRNVSGDAATRKDAQESPAVQRERCGSQYGMFTYDLQGIKDWRSQFICQPVSLTEVE